MLFIFWIHKNWFFDFNCSVTLCLSEYSATSRKNIVSNTLHVSVPIRRYAFLRHVRRCIIFQQCFQIIPLRSDTFPRKASISGLSKGFEGGRHPQGPDYYSFFVTPQKKLKSAGRKILFCKNTKCGRRTHFSYMQILIFPPSPPFPLSLPLLFPNFLNILVQWNRISGLAETASPACGKPLLRVYSRNALSKPYTSRIWFVILGINAGDIDHIAVMSDSVYDSIGKWAVISAKLLIPVRIRLRFIRKT